MRSLPHIAVGLFLFRQKKRSNFNVTAWLMAYAGKVEHAPTPIDHVSNASLRRCKAAFFCQTKTRRQKTPFSQS
tara:strand:+ start:385 stop:606 length:222 start_codon:yes stop_codon:yes gene_type:complete